jgi:hypothetical protein
MGVWRVEFLLIGNMSGVEKYDTTQDVVCIMEKFPGRFAMPLSSVNLIKKLGVE